LFVYNLMLMFFFFFFQAEDGIRDRNVTGVQTCALPILYLSEYASDRVKKVFKPLLELLAGIPTIVYGFFAFTFVTPLLREMIPSLEPTNILSPGLVMGVMIIPMIASMSEDAMN